MTSSDTNNLKKNTILLCFNKNIYENNFENYFIIFIYILAKKNNYTKFCLIIKENKS